MSFDLQVNGYGGVDFNSDRLTPEGLHQACAHLREDGVEGILLTLITDEITTLEKRLRRLVRMRESDSLLRELIVGFHIEGPFINENAGFRGTHPRELIYRSGLDKCSRTVIRSWKWASSAGDFST